MTMLRSRHLALRCECRNVKQLMHRRAACLEGQQRQHARRHGDERLVAHEAQLGDAAVGDVVDLVDVLLQEPAAVCSPCEAQSCAEVTCCLTAVQWKLTTVDFRGLTNGGHASARARHTLHLLFVKHSGSAQPMIFHERAAKLRWLHVV